MAGEKYEVEIEKPEDDLFVGIVYFWQVGYTAPEEIGRTNRKGMRPDVIEEAKGIARRHRDGNERVVLDLDED